MRQLVDDFAFEYEREGDFKEYVDKYCKCFRHKKSVAEALEDKVVQEYFKSLMSQRASCDTEKDVV